MKLPVLLLVATVFLTDSVVLAQGRRNDDDRGRGNYGDHRPGDNNRPGNGHGNGNGNRPGNGNNHGPGYGAPPRPNPAPIPRPPDHRPPSYFESDVNFYAVSRRSGGEWLRVSFRRAASIDYINLRVLRAAVKAHETYLITSYGRRLMVRNLSRTGTIYSSLTSEALDPRERIVAIDIRAEAMGGNADVRVSVASRSERVYIDAMRF